MEAIPQMGYWMPIPVHNRVQAPKIDSDTWSSGPALIIFPGYNHQISTPWATGVLYYPSLFHPVNSLINDIQMNPSMSAQWLRYRWVIGVSKFVRPTSNS